jgi:hypothetical protein
MPHLPVFPLHLTPIQNPPIRNFVMQNFPMCARAIRYLQMPRSALFVFLVGLPLVGLLLV